MTEHVGQVVLHAGERELDRVADRELVDAHHGVRPRRVVDVVVVRLVLEAVEPEVFEAVGGPEHMQRRAVVVEADLGDHGAAERLVHDVVRQPAGLHHQLHRTRVDGNAVLGHHRDRQLLKAVAASVRGILAVDGHRSAPRRGGDHGLT